MKILKLIIRLLFKFKSKKIGKLEEGGCYVLIYEFDVVPMAYVKSLQQELYQIGKIKLSVLPIFGNIDKVKII